MHCPERLHRGHLGKREFQRGDDRDDSLQMGPEIVQRRSS